jgi:hypothetical protein
VTLYVQYKCLDGVRGLVKSLDACSAFLQGDRMCAIS